MEPRKQIHIFDSFEDAERWEIEQLKAMTPSEKLLLAFRFHAHVHRSAPRLDRKPKAASESD